MGKEKLKLTDWQSKEKEAESEWIKENLPAIQPLALAEYDEVGPGAVIVKIGEEMRFKDGYPVHYAPSAELEESEDIIAIRLLDDYDPLNELIVVMEKLRGVSSYHLVSLNKEFGE